MQEKKIRAWESTENVKYFPTFYVLFLLSGEFIVARLVAR